MSTSTVDAKTRIGNGAWSNFKGELIAQNVADLHTADKNKISGTTALTEKGTWNAVHASQGCGLEHLQPTGGAGLLYCFATN